VSQRFDTLMKVGIKKVDLTSPVEPIKAALLKDRIDNIMLLQLKFSNLTKGKLKTLTVGVTVYDKNKNQIGNELTHKYILDSAKVLKEFGDREAIPVPKETAEFDVRVISVKSKTSNDWDVTLNGDRRVSPRLKPIKELPADLQGQLKKEVKKLSKGEVTYQAYEENNYWVCSCGRPNDTNENTCIRCGMKKDLALNYTDETYLRNKLEVPQRKNQEQQKSKERKNNAGKHKLNEVLKPIGIGMVIGLVFISVAFFLLSGSVL